MAPQERQTLTDNSLFNAISLTVESLLCILSLLANTLILIAFARCRQLRKRSSNVLLIFLVCGRFECIVVVTFPFSAMIVNGYPHNYYGCLFMVCTSTLSIQLIISALFIIAVDRFIAVRWPFNHAVYCSRSRIIKSVAILWVIGAGFIYLPMFGWNHRLTIPYLRHFLSVVANSAHHNVLHLRVYILYRHENVENCWNRLWCGNGGRREPSQSVHRREKVWRHYPRLHAVHSSRGLDELRPPVAQLRVCSVHQDHYMGFYDSWFCLSHYLPLPKQTVAHSCYVDVALSPHWRARSVPRGW